VKREKEKKKAINKWEEERKNQLEQKKQEI
jgi:hypothetical protein